MTNGKLSVLLKQIIEECTAGLPGQIRWYTKFNQSVKVIDDTLSEVITAAFHNTICGGTAGGGWDHCDNGEAKNTSHVQSKFCGACDKKVSFFAEECPHCSHTKFKASKKQKNTKKNSPCDGRWSISAKSHFKWYSELNEYRLTLIEPVVDHHSCREFRVRYWVVSKDSQHLNAYAQAQLDSDKSNHINFQPLGVDFYLSLPVKKFDGILTVHENSTEFEFDFFDPDNTTPEQIPSQFAGKTTESVVGSKNFNKERGEWVRN